MTSGFYPDQVTIDEILDELNRLGIEVEKKNLPGTIWGAYAHGAGKVFLRPGLSGVQERFALMHELLHVRRGDAGHQEPRVERRINREVAVSLISAREFITASKLHGGHIGAISAEIGAPVWAVEAFADHLRQRMYR